MQNDNMEANTTPSIPLEGSDEPELIGRGSIGDVYSWYGQNIAYKTLQEANDASVEALLREHDL